MNQARVTRRRPTMHDVADEAGVSLKTVSRVVNREGGVRPDLVDRVKTAIDDLGYQRHDSARQLRTGGGASRTIGFVQLDVANPFFSAIYRGIEDVSTAHGYQVIAGSSDGDSDQQDAVLRALISRRVDGIIIVPWGDRLGLLTAEMERNTAVVFLDLEPPAGIAGDLVRSDHRGGARTITRHLIEHGHERIAFIGDHPSIFSAEERFQGFAEAMSEAGLVVDRRWVNRELGDPTRTREAVAHVFENYPDDSAPTAIVAGQNFITIVAVQTLHDLDLHHRVALVGFDDVELSDVVEPGITVMPQSPRELGQRAAHLLLRRLGGYDGPPELEIPDDRIIVRGSGEIAPPEAGAARVQRAAPSSSRSRRA
jgi:LacI family transcriptional regulator